MNLRPLAFIALISLAFAAGCGARHFVVERNQVDDLNDNSWTIVADPNEEEDR